MKNLKIGKKLFVAFMAVIIGLAAISTYGLLSIRSITSADKAMYDQNLSGVSALSGLTVTFYELRTSAMKAMYENFNYEGSKALKQQLEQSTAELTEYLNAYEANIDAGDQADFNMLKSSIEEFENQVSEMATKISDQNSKAAQDQMTLTEGSALKVASQISAMNIDNSSEGNATVQSNQKLGTMSTYIMLTIAAAAGVVAVLLAFTVTKGIARPVNKLVDAAKKLAAGNTDIELAINTKDEIGVLAGMFEEMTASIKALIADANMLSEAAMAGKFDTRADVEKHQGDYRKIVEGVNATLDTVVDKVFWFETVLDSLPWPISVTDMDMKWTFINKAVEDMLPGGESRAEAIGLPCSKWGSDMCGTNDCNICQMNRGIPSIVFHDKNSNEYHQVDTCFIKDKNGENIGHIELVQDVSPRMRGQAYNANEVKKLANNLMLLKEGNLKLEFEVSDCDEDTVQERENFLEINRNFKAAVDEISGYINELSRVLGQFAEGDLTQNISSEFRGDFVSLKDSINRIVSSMNGLLSGINTAAEQVAQGAQQVSAGNQAISQGATEQASSIEQLSASISEIAEQTNDNAENSKKSNEMVMTAKTAAAHGNVQMKEMLKSMEEINESSENISKIIKVIDDIAFQTNMLALNAAVEAARAGAHGKGFAVVAEEVRNLAARSAKAAAETSELIEGSKRKVGAGTKIANETADALNRIVESVDKTVVLGEKIAIASNEQSIRIGQVTQGIQQMSQVVQTNSATSQEGAAASEELSGQAELLKEKIGMFRLQKTAGQAKLTGSRTEDHLLLDEQIFFEDSSKY